MDGVLSKEQAETIASVAMGANAMDGDLHQATGVQDVLNYLSLNELLVDELLEAG